jgi:hypothetical protein
MHVEHRMPSLIAMVVIITLLVAASTIWVEAQPPAPTIGPRSLKVLETLGAAYAADVGLTLTRIQIAGAVQVGADSIQLAQSVEQNLTIGHAREAGSFATIPLAELRPILKIEMGGNRTPGAVVRSVVTSGNVLVVVNWHLRSPTLGDLAPIATHAVFSPGGELLFDSMLSLPVIVGPMLSVGHP